jgi:hypothetical protein
MFLAALQEQIHYSRPGGRSVVVKSVISYEVKWVVLALALAWVLWLVVRAYQRARRKRRRGARVPAPTDACGVGRVEGITARSSVSSKSNES